MFIDENIQGKLYEIAYRYTTRVISTGFPHMKECYIRDGSPSASYTTNAVPMIALPMSKTSIESFFGERDITSLSLSGYLAVFMGMLFHEAAHLCSKQSWKIGATQRGKLWYTQSPDEYFPAKVTNQVPHVIGNIVRDGHDFGFVPNTWKVSPFYTQALWSLMKHGEQNVSLQNTPTKDNVTQILEELLRVFLQHMRFLHVREDDTWKEKADRIAPELQDTYNALIPMASLARRETDPAKRAALILDVHNVLKEFYQKFGDELNRGFNTVLSSILDPTTKGFDTFPTLGDIQKALGDIGECQTSSGKSVTEEIAETTGVDLTEGKGSSKTGDQTKEGHTGSHYTPEDVSATRQALRRTLASYDNLLYQLTSHKSKKLSFKRAQDLYIRPNTPHIWKVRRESTRGKNYTNAHVMLILDRSGSMLGSKIETCCSAACLILEALWKVPKTNVTIMSFNTGFTIDISSSLSLDNPESGLNILRTTLIANGGTDVTRPVHQAIELLRESQSHSRIMIIVNDGDLTGQFDLKSDIAHARKQGITPVMLGVDIPSEKMVLYMGSRSNCVSVRNIRSIVDSIPNLIIERIKS